MSVCAATGPDATVHCAQLESLPAMVRGVWSEDPQQQLEATTQFRKLLSIGAQPSRSAPQLAAVLYCILADCAVPAAERNPPIEEVIGQGVIPRFVQFLQRPDVPQLQVRTAFLCCRHLPHGSWC